MIRDRDLNAEVASSDPATRRLLGQVLFLLRWSVETRQCSAQLIEALYAYTVAQDRSILSLPEQETL